MLLVIPATEEKKWPTLGLDVCDWMQHNLAHGPGDRRGRELELTEEARAIVCRLYEVFPLGHPRAGRRRFKRGHIDLAKGLAKTELLALLAIAELHPDAPVRCDGFGRRGRPIGVGVPDPFIPLVAYTEEQSEDLAYGALRVILEHSRIANDFDIGVERVMRAKGDGIVRPFASAPDSNDGARTTFQGFDEVHRFRRRSRAALAHKTMQANIPKRRVADAWSLETTTAFSPGEGSVAEAAFEHAVAIRDGKASDPAFFFFYRCADEKLVVKREDGTVDHKALAKAIVSASGPAASWRDIEGIASQWDAADADHSYLERVWLNRILRDSDKAFDLKLWKKRAKPEAEIPAGALVTLGFDGARSDDSAALVATDVETGLQQLLGLWERPTGEVGEGWEIPESDVSAAVEAAFERFEVWRFYADPPYWESTVAAWMAQYGEERVVRWPTYRYFKMAHAIRGFLNAITNGPLAHGGDERLTRHVGNAHRRYVSVRDDKGARLFVLTKDREGSPNKIDAAMAAILSWEARTDAVAASASKAPEPTWEVAVLG